MTQEAKVCKMSDLVRLSGVSKQTIHFYLREGLTAARYAPKNIAITMSLRLMISAYKGMQRNATPLADKKF